MPGVFLDSSTLGDDINFVELTSTLDDWQLYSNTQPEQIIERSVNADIIISNKVVLTADIINQLPQLKLICISATGTNNVDLEAAKSNNVAVCNVKGYSTQSVAQHVFTLLLALQSSLPHYIQDVQNNRWQQSDNFCFFDYPMAELSGKTLGLIGYGDIAKQVEKIANAFGMRVIVAQSASDSTQLNRLPLNALLPQIDILSVHCPLTDATKDLISWAEFNVMKKSAIVINTARGGIVNEQALAEALQKNLIAGAGIDVLSAEPPTDGNPLLEIKHPNLIVTPHIAWAYREARERLLHELVLNIQGFLNNQPRNTVI
jgi:glycerate dehydrogenase